ncbi:predicted protein [Postia placenta Mad-698-R]|uniref:Uncharacterized protein n=1 Tax=Postia placenta MAD-698-R-SB12 TaxID=670580 RepID=A0A1X6MZS7_9APHY|nr:hypothetical protein POSPLADRAFT_1057614 [Postia placenta MAD-698-R-SB12]EED79478.1 predicted protein [Postia placenta Mad-698-R]OSX61855.1 hypothetical protein POSPLADRAFT_1057614 [Postia placenta MAD-698-R-SB12]
MAAAPGGMTGNRIDGLPSTEDVVADVQRAQSPTMAQITSLEGELRTARKELEELQGKEERSRSVIQWFQAELTESQTYAKSIEDELRKFSGIKEQLREERRLTHSLGQQLATAQAAHSNTTALLDMRSSELKDAQRFLTKTDPLSDADVVRMVEHLNSQIFQAAARIADSVNFPHSNTARHGSRAGHLVGPVLAKLLQQVSHADDAFCMQLALQAGIIAWTKWLLETWNFDPRGDEGLFHDMHAYIKNKESQTVSGRWRALAHSYLMARLSDAAQSTLLDHLVLCVADLLLASGAGDCSEQAVAFIRDRHGEPLRSIIMATLQLRTVMWEDIVSRDFETTAVSGGERFDHESMKDDFNSQARTREDIGGNVLCTTGIGLVRSEKCEGPEGATRTVKVLLKAAVALESVVHELSLAAHA